MVEYVEGSVCDTIKSTSKKKNSKLLKLFSEDFSIPIVEEKVKKAKKEKDEVFICIQTLNFKVTLIMLNLNSAIFIDHMYIYIYLYIHVIIVLSTS